MPPLGPDEDILEIDLDLSESSESDSEEKGASIEKVATTNTNKNENLTVVKPNPIKKVTHSLGKSRLHPSLLEKIDRPKTNFENIQAKPITGVKRANPWSKIPAGNPPEKRAPSPTFARFNPGLVCPRLPSSIPTIIINNYYGHSAPKQPPQCVDPARMSRGQFQRFANRKSTTQEQVSEALAIRNALKKQQ